MPMQTVCVCVCVYSFCFVCHYLYFYSHPAGLFCLPASDFPFCQPATVKSCDCRLSVLELLLTDDIVAVHFL